MLENHGAPVEIDTIVTLLGYHVVYFMPLKGQNQTWIMNINRFYQKKCPHVKLLTPFFNPQFLCIKKTFGFFLTQNLKTKSPPSLQPPTMYVFHRASWPTEML